VEKIQVIASHYSEDELMKYAASGEQESSHILARSLVRYAKKQQLSLYPVTNLEEITGQGIEAQVNGKNVRVGKAAFAGSANE
ncbi:heavy metal translocating P-type ATPase, partial [Enterococcus faecium]